MARRIRLQLGDGQEVFYDNVPDDVTPDQVTARAASDYPGLGISLIERLPSVQPKHGRPFEPDTLAEEYGVGDVQTAPRGPVYDSVMNDPANRRRSFAAPAFTVPHLPGSKQPSPFEQRRLQDTEWLKANRDAAIEAISRTTGQQGIDAVADYEARLARGLAGSLRADRRQSTGGELFAARAAQVPDALRTGLAGIAMAAADNDIDKEEFRKVAERLKGNTRQSELGLKPDKGSLPDLVSSALPSLALNAPPIIASSIAAARGNMPLAAQLGNVGLAGMGANKFGTAYVEGDEAGLSGGRNFAQAGLSALAEIGPEKISLGQFIKTAETIGRATGLTGKDALKEGMKEVGKRLGITYGTEQVTEQMTTAGDALIDYAFKNPDRTLDDWLKEAKQTAIQTAIQTPILQAAGIGGAAVGSIRTKDQRLSQEIERAFAGDFAPATEAELAQHASAANARGMNASRPGTIPPVNAPAAAAQARGATQTPMGMSPPPEPDQDAPARGRGIASESLGVSYDDRGIDASVWESRGENAGERNLGKIGEIGQRQKKQTAGLSADESAAIATNAQKHGLDAGAVAEAARAAKRNYPASDGWAQPVVAGVDPAGKTPSEQVKFKVMPYTFHIPPGETRAPRDNTAWETEVARRMVADLGKLTERAKTDPKAQQIIDHMTWYREMARRLRQEFGGFGDVFADLLGATSPNTPVRTNWQFSVDALRRFVRGDFDAQLEAAEKHLEAGGTMDQLKDNPGALITQITGKKYGMNSDKAMKALLGMWRSIQAGSAPKARNFALNLIGQSDKATIDVWAARYLQRLAGLKRIPPAAEGAVGGTHLADPSQIGGQFGFGVNVFAKAAEEMQRRGINVTATDLQAVVWFAEKEIWTDKGWTRGLGNEGSFEDEANKAPVDRYQAGATIERQDFVPGDEDMAGAGAGIEASVSSDPNVITYRALPTVGHYAGANERSFDTEVVAKAGWDPSQFVAEVARMAKRADQWDAFVSRVLEAREDSPNWRPGIEVYFKTAADMNKAVEIMGRITQHGVDGFTLIKDVRERRHAKGGDTGGYIGLRLQYIPEIAMRWADDGDPDVEAMLSGDQAAIDALMERKLDQMEAAVKAVRESVDVAYAGVTLYDTLVMGKENYDEYTAGAQGSDRPQPFARGEGQRGTAQVLSDAAVRLGKRPSREVGGTDVPSRGQGVRAEALAVVKGETLSLRGNSYGLDSENFGFPPPPKSLPDDSPLLRPTWGEKTGSTFGKNEKRDGQTTEQLHVSIINRHFANAKPVPPGQRPKLVLMAGGGGSGKGHVKKLIEGMGALPESAVDLDPDEIKTKMIPEFAMISAAGDSRGAAVTHEESSYLSKKIFKRAVGERYNLIYDRTMAEEAKGLALIEEAIAAGYDVEMHVVLTDARVAAVQAMERAAKSWRYVPPGAFLAAHKGLAQALDAYIDSGKISAGTVWDNTGNSTIIGEFQDGKLELSDRESYNEVVRKGVDIAVDATTLRAIYPHGGPYGNQGGQAAVRAAQVSAANTGGGREGAEGVRGRGGRGGDGDAGARQEDARAPQVAAQTSSPEFKRWFGDSKVVDANGEPLVVYHGTDSDFSEFEPTDMKEGGHPTSFLGIFTTDNPSHAEDYGDFTMPLYLSIQNPYEMSAKEFERLVDSADMDDWAATDDMVELRSRLIEQGYDGIVVRATKDSRHRETEAAQWVAFRPEQIKSAIGNNGQFDPGNPDIRAARGDLTNARILLGIQMADGGKAVDQSAFSPRTDEFDMRRRQIQPLEQHQADEVNNALNDVSRLMPIEWVEGVTYYGLKPTQRSAMIYAPADGSVAVGIDELGQTGTDGRARLRLNLAHELSHRIDNYSYDRKAGVAHFISDESPRMDIEIADGKVQGVGDLAAEAAQLWSDQTDIGVLLNYPMFDAITTMTAGGNQADAIAFAKVEIFAQMSAVWHTNPKLLEREAPRWAAMFKEWEDARQKSGGNSVEASRRTLRGVLSKSDSVSRVAFDRNRGRQAGGSAGANRVGPAEGRAGSGLGGVRAAARVAGGSPPVGGQAGNPPAALIAKGAVFLRSPQATPDMRRVAGQPNYDVLLPAKNYRTANTPDEVRATIAALVRDHKTEIERQRRGRVPVQQTYREAEAMFSQATGLSASAIPNLLHREPGTAAGAAELLARRDLAITAADDLKARADKIRSGKASTQEQAEFAAAVDRAGMLFSMFMGARAEAGRALNILKQTARLSAQVDAMQDAITAYGGANSLMDLANLIGTTASPPQVLQIARAAQKPGALDALIELWKSNLLTGPTTHLTNVISNALFTAMRVPEHFVAGLFGALTGGTRVEESLAMGLGMFAGTVDGMRYAVRAIFDEDTEIPGGVGVTEVHQHAISGETFGLGGAPGKAIDYIGKAVRAPSFRMLQAEDAFFRLTNISMTLYAEATRQALKEGRQQWQGSFAHRVAQLVNEARMGVIDPSLRISPEARRIADDGVQAGLRYTFQEKLGKIGQSISAARANVPALQFVLPFVRTPMNIFRQGIERTPLAPLAKQWRDDIRAGGHRRDAALARTTLGTGMGYIVIALAAGGMVTGGGDPDREQKKRRREAGIPDYAVKIGDKWYEYRRMEPFGVTLGLAADAAEVWDYMGQEDRENLVAMLSMAFAQNVTSKTFMSGISDLVNAIGDPERYGSRWVKRFAGSVVPGAVGQVASAKDPVVRDDEVYGRQLEKAGAAEKTAADLLNAIKARVPKTGHTPEFNSEALPAKLDSYGEPIKRLDRTFPFSPIRTSKESEDPVRREAYRLRVKTGDWPKKVGGVKVSPEERWEFAEHSGKLAHKVLSQIVTSNGYDKLPDPIKTEVWDSVFTASRKYGKAMITPKIIDGIIDNAMKRVEIK